LHAKGDRVVPVGVEFARDTAKLLLEVVEIASDLLQTFAGRQRQIPRYPRA
jgi:hypothetical protein